MHNRDNTHIAKGLGLQRGHSITLDYVYGCLTGIVLAMSVEAMCVNVGIVAYHQRALQQTDAREYVLLRGQVLVSYGSPSLVLNGVPIRNVGLIVDRLVRGALGHLFARRIATLVGVRAAPARNKHVLGLTTERTGKVTTVTTNVNVIITVKGLLKDGLTGHLRYVGLAYLVQYPCHGTTTHGERLVPLLHGQDLALGNGPITLRVYAQHGGTTAHGLRLLQLEGGLQLGNGVVSVRSVLDVSSSIAL